MASKLNCQSNVWTINVISFVECVKLEKNVVMIRAVHLNTDVDVMKCVAKQKLHFR